MNRTAGETSGSARPSARAPGPLHRRRRRSAISATSRCGRWRSLAGVDLILAEDTRHSRRLLDHYGIATPLSAYHEHNAERARPEIARPARAGRGAGADLRRRHAADLRPRLQARRRGGAGGARGASAARRLGAAGGAGRGGPADRPLPVRGLPAAEIRGAAGAAQRAGRRSRRRWCSTRRRRRLAASPRRSRGRTRGHGRRRSRAN